MYNIITIDYGPAQEPERIENVVSIQFTGTGILVFYQTIRSIRYGVQIRFFGYNSYVTMTIH